MTDDKSSSETINENGRLQSVAVVEGTMGMKVIILIVFFCASFSDGATQFNLNFVYSTNKVVVTDFYYMLEYSIIRGRNANMRENIG